MAKVLVIFWKRFGGDGAVLVDYVRVRLLWHIDAPLRFQRQFTFGHETCVLKFRYEKLRSFCTIYGMLTHDASECPLGNNPPPPPPVDDDDDEDPYFDSEEPAAPVQNNDQEPEEKYVNETSHEEEQPSSSKKRKTETPSPQEHTSAVPMFCCEMRQTYATDDTQQNYFKRNRIESEVLEV